MTLRFERAFRRLRPILLALSLLLLGQQMMKRWGYDYFVPFVASVVALSVLAEWGLRTRERLSVYQDAAGRPREILPIATAIVRGVTCPACGGDVVHALAADDWGLQLSIASERRGYSDGSLCYDRLFLTAEVEERLDGFRGIGRGGWCKNCEQFFLLEKVPAS